MKYTRLFTGADGQSYFEEAYLPLESIQIGQISSAISVKNIFFGKLTDVREVSWHNPPCPQYVIMLQGSMEIETGNGTKRIFHEGDILLAEDTTGQGHITRAASEGPRKYLAIPLETN